MAAAASPGSGPGSFGSSDWIVLRDGCLRCDEEGLRSLSYHPALNAILAVTSRGSIKVVDGTSGAILQASALHGEDPAAPSPTSGTRRSGGRQQSGPAPLADGSYPATSAGPAGFSRAQSAPDAEPVTPPAPSRVFGVSGPRSGSFRAGSCGS